MLTLSEAIRLGAMMKPQCYGGLGGHDQTCAIGAALDAVNCLSVSSALGSYQAFAAMWPWTQSMEFALPVDVPSKWSTLWNVMDMIASLNDDARWTRERIADWVATIEPKESVEVRVSIPLVSLKAGA